MIFILKSPSAFIYLICLISQIFSLEYKKNKQIKLREKQQNYTRVLEIENLDLIKNKLDLKKSNFMLVFYADWCVHCKDLLETLDTVSSYQFTKPFDFLKVNCNKHKSDICAHFNINAYPTVKVFLKGEETPVTPYGRDIETLLEYVDKINSPQIINVKSSKRILKYSEEYGDVSFMLVEDEQDKNNKETYKCFQKLSEDVNYKPLFHFFFLSKQSFKNQNQIKLPAVINLGVNREFNIHLPLQDETNPKVICDKIKRFLEENRYPIIKRLDTNYMSRIQRDKKIVLIAAINKKEIGHINFLNTFFHNIALNKRQYVFSYLDVNEDSHFLQFFNLKPEDIPKIIIYDFSKGKHFIDKYSYLEDSNALTKLNELLGKLDSDDIKWTTGYYFEDLLSNLGINISRTNLMVVLLGLLTAMIIIVIFCGCNLIEKQQALKENDNDKKLKPKDVKKDIKDKKD